MFDLLKYEKELEERKDKYWARKVIYLCGFKTAMQVIKAPSGNGNALEVLFQLVARDTLCDLVEHYPGRNKTELSKEMIADSDELLSQMLEQAMEEIGDD